MSDQQPASSDPDVPSEGPAPDAVPAPPVEPPVWPAAAPPTAQVPSAPPVPPYTPPPGGMYAPAPAYPPAPAYAAAPSTSSNAIIALVLSILSWVVCPLVPAIIATNFAWVAGSLYVAFGPTFAPTVPGQVFVCGQAAVVLILAELQVMSLRRGRRTA